ncbi:MAG: O-antigen ligase family protein [Campylobacteraceae bacterium]|nr:O-antigen ligase family protein [Campylobacteraceae bacterium]
MNIAIANFRNKIDDINSYLLITFAFFLPLSRAGISILSVLMILMWLFQGDFKKKYENLKDNVVIIALVLFVGFEFISLVWTTSENIGHGLDQAFKTTRLVLLPILVIATTLKKEYIPKVITAFLIGMLISEILSYGIFFELWTLRHGSPSDPTPFMHHLDYSTFLTFTSLLLLLLNRYFDTNNLKLKAFYFIYFLFVTSNLFLNGGRTGHLAFAISIFAVGFVNIKNKFIAFFSMLILVIAIFYAAYNISPVFKQRFDAGANEISKLESNSNSKYKGSFGQRLGAWIVAIDMVKDNHLLGTGGGSEMVEFKKYAQNSSSDLQVVQNITHFHNEYVHTIVEYGIVGLILYLIIWYSLFKMPMENTNFSNLRVIFITVFCTASTVEVLFHNQFPMSLFALFVGIFISLSKSQVKRKI